MLTFVLRFLSYMVVFQVTSAYGINIGVSGELHAIALIVLTVLVALAPARFLM